MKISAFLSLILFIFTACDSSKKEDGFVLKFGHLASEDNTWHKAALKFKALVEERTQGKVQVKIYPNSQLGKEMDLINSIQLGTADMTITGESLQNWAPEAALLAVPYAFESSEEMRHAASSPAADKISSQITAKTGLVPLAWFERGPRYLTSNVPVSKLEDLKGVKIRVPNVPLFLKFWEELGAKPTPMAFSEVFTSLQQNTIDAQENPLSLIDSASFSEVQKCVNLTAHVRSWIYVVIGKEKLESMPADLQKIVQDAASEMQAYENELFKEEEKRLRKKLEEAGMKFNEVQLQEFAAKGKKAVMEALTEDQRTLLEQLKN